MYVYFAIGAALLLIGRKKENMEEIPKCVEAKVTTPVTPQVEPTLSIPPVIETPPVPVVPTPPSPTGDFDPLAIDPQPQPKRKGRKK